MTKKHYTKRKKKKEKEKNKFSIKIYKITSSMYKIKFTLLYIIINK